MVNDSDGDFIFLFCRPRNWQRIEFVLRFACLLTLTTCAPVSRTSRGTAPSSTREAISRDSVTGRFYALVGTVFDSASGRPLEATQVLLRENPAAQPYFVQTDKTGAFVFSGIKPGHYQLLVRRVGYLPYVGQRDASPGRVDTLRIRLPRLPLSGGEAYTFPIHAVAPTSRNTRTIPCRRPTITMTDWSESRLSRVPIALRMPPWFRRDLAEAHVDSLRSAAGDTALTLTSLATNGIGVPRAQLVITVVDSVTLAFGGDRRPEESECHEEIDGAQAIVFSFNQSIEVGDMAYVGPYIISAQLRFRDGLSLEVFAGADKREQQDEMLAAIRTIRRIPRAR